jgi:2-polyprenyl-6-methoxyphenol hydroxylase-like FAD-dependent oxidoreductase
MPDERPLNAPVAIVGGGPVGLALALFLDRHGVRSVVFNLENTSRWHPKGSTHNSRTMEHYRRLGIASRIRGLGLPADHPTDVAYFTRFNAWELARLRMPSEAEKMARVAAAPVTDQVPEPIQRANQMYVEEVLLAHAGTRPNISLRFGWRCSAFSEDAEGVTAHIEQADGGGRETWRSAYLVGCDGASSFVRRSLGIRYHGFDRLEQAFYGGRMLSTYLRAPTLYRDCLGQRRAWQYWVVNEQIRTCAVALNGKDEFLFWTKLQGEDAQPDDAAVVQALQRSAGADIPVEILAHGSWTAGAALVAESFGSGRVRLCGDAIHLFTPTGGFGMNTGLDDAANLSWKLAALVQGWGGTSLLDSYEIERKPIAQRNTSAARELAKNIGEVQALPGIEDPTPQGEAARRDVGAFLSTFGEEFASLGVQLGARYDGSPIIASDAPAPADDFRRYVPTSIPGGRAPHLWLADRSSLFDHFGVGFTLLRLGTADSAGIESAARRLNIPLTVLDVTQREARALYDCELALIRPDQHVGWRGNKAPEDAESLLARLSGRLG